ncbi:MAG: penicillin acylase family protein [Rhodothermales bacterium]|nr:penicillin acylase family protein [Rhodothermales bacterium]MBO6780617.1 penicillin acylase family protein [Rhodothermales bacterium]
MRSVLLTIFWILASLVVMAAAAWHLAFRQGVTPPAGVQAPTSAPWTIQWHEGGDAVLNVASGEDVETALGVAHGLGHPWIMALYRQAALGRLSEWFGPETIPFDTHVRTLGVAPPEHTPIPAALDRYAAGVRAAQAGGEWSLLPVPTELGLNPEPWHARHSIAVERLVTWLSTTVGPEAHPLAVALDQERHALAEFLGLHALNQAALWVTEQHGLFARLTLGNSGAPALATYRIVQGGRQLYAGATIPGLPYRFCGSSGAAAWCKPFSSSARVETDSTATTTSYFAVQVADGSQVAGSRTTTDNGISFDEEVLRWPGLRVHTDAEQWLSLPDANGFALATGLGLAVSQGTVSLLGDTPLVRSGSVVLQTMGPEANLLAARIDAVDDTLRWAPGLFLDTGSVLTDSVALSVEDEAVDSYLRNWDGRFEGSSIAASVYDLATMFGPDAALDSLRAWFGTDTRTWRWELDPALQLRYPGAQPAGLSGRYGPVQWLRSGHPSSPSFAPSRAWSQDMSAYRPAAAWESWLGSRDGALAYRRPYVPYERFLGRYRVAPVRADLLEFSEAPGPTTRVSPGPRN